MILQPPETTLTSVAFLSRLFWGAQCISEIIHPIPVCTLNSPLISFSFDNFASACRKTVGTVSEYYSYKMSAMERIIWNGSEFRYSECCFNLIVFKKNCKELLVRNSHKALPQNVIKSSTEQHLDFGSMLDSLVVNMFCYKAIFLLIHCCFFRNFAILNYHYFILGMDYVRTIASCSSACDLF